MFENGEKEQKIKMEKTKNDEENERITEMVNYVEVHYRELPEKYFYVYIEYIKQEVDNSDLKTLDKNDWFI